MAIIRPAMRATTPPVWRLPQFRGDPKAGRVSAEVQTPGRPHQPAAAGPRMDLLVRDGAAADQAANLALEEALARAACAASGVPVLRRASGGGTVFQDLGNLNVSLAVPGRAPGLAADLAGLVAAVVAGLGLTPRAGERGVFVGPAKVSGLASHVTRDGSLAHATLLVTTPAARVGAFLTSAPAERHPTDSRRSPVASLRELGSGIGVAGARAAVAAEAARRHGPLRRRATGAAEERWRRR